MTTPPNLIPGLAGYDTDTYTPVSLLIAGGPGPTREIKGRTYENLPIYSLVGIVTETGDLVLSNPAATNGSQIPVGVTNMVATDDRNDSNSTASDSNSLGDNLGTRVTYFADGVFNFNALNKHVGWTLATLQRSLATNNRQFYVDVPNTSTPTEPA